MSLFKDKRTGMVILVMAILFLLGLGIAKLYYGNVNSKADPRTVKARKLYDDYNELTRQNPGYPEVVSLMDSIEDIYKGLAHYQKSYEVGVLYNNRSAAYLTEALRYINDSMKAGRFLQLAKSQAQSAIEIYREWIATYDSLSVKEIRADIEPGFTGLDVDKKQLDGILGERAREMVMAQRETPRRLSVSYTLMGTIYRHQDSIIKSVECYTTALDLWDKNLTAKNNLNILLERPMEKRRFIDKMFPEER